MPITPLACRPHLPGSKTRHPAYPEVSFNFRWPGNTVAGLKYESTYSSSLGDFSCEVRQDGDSFYFKVSYANEGYLSEFIKNGEILSLDKISLATHTSIIDEYDDDSISLVFSLPRNILQSKDNCFEVIFRFSDQLPKSPILTSPKERSLGEVLLDKLFEDTDSQDIHFVFDSLSGSDTKGPGTGIIGQDTVLGAHKLVLRQWPYFKTMFESGLSESGTGDKMIRIKDTQPEVFRLLLRYMYTGKIPEEAKPTTAYVDSLSNKGVSWESLYLAAHRYDIQELCQSARDNIVAGLDSVGTVPFLFRSAYLFEDLREPVIKHVAVSCGATLASKIGRERYMDHPESAQIFGELFEHIYAAKK